jgi:protease-4
MIGVLDLSGSIVPGVSRSFPIPLPLLGGEILGSNSVQQQVRAARKRDDLAAVVAYVDSPGGSALASDLMWRELSLLAQEKPLVIYMGPTAASGGYYIATPGHAILAQEATLTGSIGVITAKLITTDAYQRIHIGRESVQRGANAALYSDAHPWNEEQRAQVESSVRLIYTTFQQRVQTGRKLSPEAVANVAEGRVWTGEQGLRRGLVDAIGDFTLAVETAARLAHMEYSTTTELRTERITASRGGLLAEPVKSARTLFAILSQPATPAGILAQAWKHALRADRFWLLADSLPRID